MSQTVHIHDEINVMPDILRNSRTSFFLASTEVNTVTASLVATSEATSELLPLSKICHFLMVVYCVFYMQRKNSLENLQEHVALAVNIKNSKQMSN